MTAAGTAVFQLRILFATPSPHQPHSESSSAILNGPRTSIESSWLPACPTITDNYFSAPIKLAYTFLLNGSVISFHLPANHYSCLSKIPASKQPDLVRESVKGKSVCCRLTGESATSAQNSKIKEPAHYNQRKDIYTSASSRPACLFNITLIVSPRSTRYCNACLD